MLPVRLLKLSGSHNEIGFQHDSAHRRAIHELAEIRIALKSHTIR